MAEASGLLSQWLGGLLGSNREDVAKKAEQKWQEFLTASGIPKETADAMQQAWRRSLQPNSQAQFIAATSPAIVEHAEKINAATAALEKQRADISAGITADRTANLIARDNATSENDRRKLFSQADATNRVLGPQQAHEAKMLGGDFMTMFRESSDLERQKLALAQQAMERQDKQNLFSMLARIGGGIAATLA